MKSTRPSIPEVEPISEARWNRIEREVFDELDRDRMLGAAPRAKVAPLGRRALLAAGGIAAAAAAVAFFGVRSFSGPAPSATLSHVETGAAPSTLTVGESTVTVERESALLVGGDAKSGVLLVLDRGSVTCDVAPRAGRPAFVVQAGAVKVRVVGTRFRVARAATGASVHVDHGMVEVTAQGSSRVLRDGETFSTEPLAAAAVPSAPSTTPPSEPAAANAESPAALASSPRRVRPAPSGKGEGIVRSPLDFEGPAPAPSQRTEYEQAARLERSDPAAAAAAYRRMADGSGPWAANALFALARLEASRGRSAEAKRLADEYVARYPQGANANDARDLARKMR